MSQHLSAEEDEVICDDAVLILSPPGTVRMMLSAADVVNVLKHKHYTAWGVAYRRFLFCEARIKLRSRGKKIVQSFCG